MNLPVVYAFAVGFACGTTMLALVRRIALMTDALRRHDDDWRIVSRRGRD